MANATCSAAAVSVAKDFIKTIGYVSPLRKTITMTLRSRSNSVKAPIYQKLIVGDAIFTDDPNDDWFCISFDKWIGDYQPTTIYLCKKTGRAKVVESTLFSTLLDGLFVCEKLSAYKFEKQHRLILEKFARSCFRTMPSVQYLGLDNVMITLARQRV